MLQSANGKAESNLETLKLLDLKTGMEASTELEHSI